jgi:hypothetical protein
MKQRMARLLRRLANSLDPQTPATPRIYMTYNGQPVDLEKAVVTALRQTQRRNGFGAV